MKKIFINLLYLLFLSSICSNVYASPGIFRDACIGAFSGSSSAKDGTKDSYANELRANIKVISGAAKVFDEGEEERKEIKNILMGEIRRLNERTEDPLSIRLMDDINDNLCHGPSYCMNSCIDMLKRTWGRIYGCVMNFIFGGLRRWRR